MKNSAIASTKEILKADQVSTCRSCSRARRGPRPVVAAGLRAPAVALLAAVVAPLAAATARPATFLAGVRAAGLWVGAAPVVGADAAGAPSGALAALPTAREVPVAGGGGTAAGPRAACDPPRRPGGRRWVV